MSVVMGKSLSGQTEIETSFTGCVNAWSMLVGHLGFNKTLKLLTSDWDKFPFSSHFNFDALQNVDFG